MAKINKVITPLLDMVFFKFCVIGLINTTANYLVFILLLSFSNISLYIAGSLGFFTGAAVGFLLNRSYSFKSNVPLLKGGLTYMLIQLCCLAIHIAVQIIGVVFFQIKPELSQLPSIFVTTLVNFILSRRLVFKT